MNGGLDRSAQVPRPSSHESTACSPILDSTSDSGYGSHVTKSAFQKWSPDFGPLLATDEEREDFHAPSSSNSIIEDSKVGSHILEFAREVVAALPQILSVPELLSLSAVLPELLERFAVRVGREGSTGLHRRLMHLVLWQGEWVPSRPR